MIISILLGILAYSTLRMGHAIQKIGARSLARLLQKPNGSKHTSISKDHSDSAETKKAPVTGLAVIRDKEFRTWMRGTGLVMLATLLQVLAINSADKPSVVIAMGGVALVVMTAFSVLYIHEPLSKPEIIGISLAVLGTVLLPLGETEEMAASESVFNSVGFWMAMILLGIFALLLLISYAIARLVNRRLSSRNVLDGPPILGIFSGMFNAIALMSLKISLILADDSIFKALRAPLIYIALSLGMFSFWFMQLAFQKGKAVTVVPIQNGTQITIPAIFEGMIFLNIVSGLQYVAFGLIVISVVLLTAFRKNESITI